MQEARVEISLGKGNIFWSLGGLVLNINDPGPKVIDFWNLPNPQKEAIRNSFKRGTIKVDGDIENPPKVVSLHRQTASLDNYEQEKLLDQGVNKIKKAVSEIQNIEFLTKCISLEEKGKNRKSAIKFISERIQRVLEHSEDDTIAQSYDSIIEESEVEEVAFDVKPAVFTEVMDDGSSGDINSSPTG